jgi:hypothetical protein
VCVRLLFGINSIQLPSLNQLYEYDCSIQRSDQIFSRTTHQLRQLRLMHRLFSSISNHASIYLLAQPHPHLTSCKLINTPSLLRTEKYYYLKTDSNYYLSRISTGYCKNLRQVINLDTME